MCPETNLKVLSPLHHFLREVKWKFWGNEREGSEGKQIIQKNYEAQDEI